MIATDSSVREAAAELQVWAYPLIFAQRLRLNFTQPGDPEAPRPAVSAGAPVGRFGHARTVADPDLQVGVAPNVDTLYSVAWLDLSTGPHVVRLPDAGKRYFSLQVGKVDTTTAVIVSGRTHPGASPLLILESGEPSVEHGAGTIRVTTRDRWLMLVGRTGVDLQVPGDLQEAQTVQQCLRVTTQNRRLPEGGVDIDLAAVPREQETSEPAAFARALTRVLETGGESVERNGLDSLLERAGIRAVADGGVGSTLLEAIRTGLADGLERIEQHVRVLGRSADGWASNELVTDFGDDYLRRAAVAHSQIYVNPPAEATYPVCEVDADGRQLDGRHAAYRLTFAPGTPPARAFWSLTMYHAAGNLVSNDLQRYAIGDRTRGLQRRDDGSLEIEIGAERPASGAANWLPAPNGPFRLMLRLYWPTEQSWQPSAVERITP